MYKTNEGSPTKGELRGESLEMPVKEQASHYDKKMEMYEEIKQRVQPESPREEQTPEIRNKFTSVRHSLTVVDKERSQELERATR